MSYSPMCVFAGFKIPMEMKISRAEHPESLEIPSETKGGSCSSYGRKLTANLVEPAAPKTSKDTRAQKSFDPC